MAQVINNPPVFFVWAYGVMVAAAFLFVVLSRKRFMSFVYFSISLVIALLFFYGLDLVMMNKVQGLPFPYK